jgi:DNA-binding response OmpR family regulator
MPEHSILIVEDDKNLVDVLTYNLKKEGYTVTSARDGEEALLKARQRTPRLIILDIMLPKMSGLELCRILRKETTAPIIMLTAKSEEIDKIVGLEVGADDYMTKPFSMRELLARVRAMLRRAEMSRAEPEKEKIINIGDLLIDTSRRRVMRGNALLSLTPKEFELLFFLAQNKGHVFSREHLLNKVWGYDFAGDSRTVDVHIRWLRTKIEPDPNRPTRLITVRGAGYKMEG